MNRSSLLSLLFFFFCFVTSSLQVGHVRFGQFSPEFMGGDKIIVAYNGQNTFQLSYAEMRPYVNFEPNKYTITVSRAPQEDGSVSEVIFTTTLNVEDNKYYTSYLYGDQANKMNISVVSSEDSVTTPDLSSGMAAIRFVQLGSLRNTSFNASRSVFFSSVSFTSATTYTAIKAAFYTFSATPFNSSPTFGKANLTIGLAYSAVFLPNSIQLFEDRDFRVAYVRVSQSSPDISSVSVTVGSRVFSNLAFRQETSYQEVPYGLQTISVKGNTTLTFNRTLDPLARYTVLTYGFSKPPKNNSNTFQAELIADPVTDPSLATVRFGNLVPDVSVMKLNFDNETYTLGYGPSFLTTLNRAPGVYEISLFNATFLSRRFARKRSGMGDLILKQNITLQLGTLSSVFAEGSNGNIVIDDDNAPTPTPTPTSTSDSGLSGGAIAGIVIACIFGACLIAGLIVYFYRRSQYSTMP